MFMDFFKNFIFLKKEYVKSLVIHHGQYENGKSLTGSGINKNSVFPGTYDESSEELGWEENRNKVVQQLYHVDNQREL